MKHSAQKLIFHIKPSYWAIICALACSPTAWAEVEAAYPNVPLSMTGGKSQIKPNVLLFVDTSGSMTFTIKDSKSTQRLPDGHPDARGTIAKAAAIEAIENNPHLRWGLATFTAGVGGATIVKQIQDPTNAHIADLKQTIENLKWGGPTPTTSAYYELLRYYRGEELHHSNNRDLNGKYQSPIEYRCQKNLLVYISDGQPDGYNRQFYHFNSGFVRDMPNTSHSNLARILRNDNTFGPVATRSLRDWDERGRDKQCYAQKGAESRAGCKVVSKPDCADDNSCHMYSEFGIADFSAIAHNQDMVTGKSDKENISFDDPQFRKQTIDTYTIGLGEDIRVLQNAARRGGGEYFPAFSREALKDALNKIVANATVASIPFTGVTPSVSSEKPNGPINAAETLSLNTEDWSSQLRFYQVDEKTGAISPSQYSLPTYNPAQSVSVISTEKGPRYLNAGNSGGSVSGLSNDTFGLADADQNAWRKLASWLTREGAADDPAWGYRVRKHSNKDNQNRYLGDSLGNLVAMGVAGSERKYLAVGSNDGMVHIFKKQDGSTAANAYTDVFQYIPGMAKQSGKTLNSRLVETAQEGYGGAKHINLVNGQISWYETYSPNKGRTRVFMAGTLGEGGRAAYALNIAGNSNGGSAVGLDDTSAKWLKGSGSGEGYKGQADYFGVPLWDTSSTQIGEAHAADAEIGHLFGEPFNGRLARTGSVLAKAASYAGTNDIFYATVLGSGFNPPSTGSDADGKLTYPAPSVYVLDGLGLEAGKSASNTVNNQSAPGRLVKRISVGGLADNIKTDAPRGMTAVTGLDIDDDGVFDVAYAGDQNGNVYRFDFRAGVANWNAEIIFKGTEAQPITAAPEVYRNPKSKRVTVLFGTGSELYASDLHETGTQRLYGIHDALTDKAEAGGEVMPLTPSSSELAQRSFTQTTVNGKTIRTLNENSRGRLTDTQRGWVMELNAAQNGERVVDKPGLGGSKSKGGTVIFSTTVFQPPVQAVQQSCTATGATQTSGFIMTLDAESGSRPVALRIMKDNLDHIGEYRSGNLASIKVQSTGFERNIFGSSSSGKATELGSAVPERRTRCEAPVGSSETGVEVLKFYCPKTSVKRIAWREVF
ncbi:MAG: PilC/PilY family type IV pilus protein [Neisseria zoodegmatis]|uniref:PilC/PilY family type IV pilus protein n=1 Tax=Neisseria zoodegmatis TaxID=326523 RepID=UPI0026EC1E03|nr:PilC/PilY family type IV pilus protein [Neisseria zoodegmatis]MDO5070315.1 PilC/PilY family type IV pilus protein [Neisseria zoodegmatis]